MITGKILIELLVTVKPKHLTLLKSKEADQYNKHSTKTSPLQYKHIYSHAHKTTDSGDSLSPTDTVT